LARANWVNKGQKRPEARHIEDDEILTQYGQTGPDGDQFHGQPRFDGNGETDLSMLVGKFDAGEALGLIAGHKAASDRDSARYFQVGALRARGYQVTHTPNRKNVYHSSVTAPAGCDPREWWNQEGGPLLDLLRLSDAELRDEN
jgi:hypothetical protein